ncbi:glycosyltransferase family 34 protein [Babjeviella inositovora NRRL Y-12698]|uniref:Glycosyltransferase family 34 protein n=1 Tax=Babjeviella inositovora NRRL Y-12698 TaxID=984486 RepID=A0A1E3QZR0_9ASCO|nr:glycosyltransferase family 34 protein [Babjeviella inositovora NRRL Y-12698]ODQ82577.1 glycosyltransferase family 34 protein [Babjeviella inositovora NRRL Y-12698]
MHLGVPTKDNFKPKGKSYLSLPTKYMRYTNKWRKTVLSFLFLVFIYLFFVSPSAVPQGKFSQLLGKSRRAAKYPKVHGLHVKEIRLKSPLIFPPIESAPLLKEIGLSGLFHTKVLHDPTTKTDKTIYQYFDEDFLSDNNELSNVNNKKDDGALLSAKKAFLNHGKRVFTGSQSPEIVVVTAIDFDKYELSGLMKIVQNRVDYAQKQSYGVYVRWIQEFVPILQKHNNDKEWTRLMVMRAAMHAFPNAKYFWYLDQDSLIMRYDIDLYDYILRPAALDPIMIRDQSVIPPGGVIKTYSDAKPESVRLFLTQLDTKIETDSFILRNDVYGKAILEFWMDPLYRTYGKFSAHQDSALALMLQWHPLILSKTALIPARTISSLNTYMELPEGGDDVHYSEGDLVVLFRDCSKHQTCQKDMEPYWKKLTTK